MENVETAKLIESAKSRFLVSLVKEESGNRYVSIRQTVLSNKIISVININPDLLSKLIVALQTMEVKLNLVPLPLKQSKIKPEQKKELVKRYLRGVNIKDLSMQFDMNEEDIVLELYRKGYPIIPNQSKQEEETKYRYRFRKR
jgi:hypothetical protein